MKVYPLGRFICGECGNEMDGRRPRLKQDGVVVQVKCLTRDCPARGKAYEVDLLGLEPVMVNYEC